MSNTSYDVWLRRAQYQRAHKERNVQRIRGHYLLICVKTGRRVIAPRNADGQGGYLAASERFVKKYGKEASYTTYLGCTF